MKAILVQVAMMVAEIAVRAILTAITGRKGVQEIQQIVELVNSDTLSGQEKFEKAKELVQYAGKDARSAIRDDLPDIVKDLAIQTLATRLNVGKLLR